MNNKVLQNFKGFLEYLDRALELNNCNPTILEYIMTILSYSIGAHEQLCNKIYKSLMNSNYKLHCISFLLGLMDKKYTVEFIANPGGNYYRRLVSPTMSSQVRKITSRVLSKEQYKESKETKTELDRIIVGAINYIGVFINYSQ